MGKQSIRMGKQSIRKGKQSIIPSILSYECVPLLGGALPSQSSRDVIIFDQFLAGMTSWWVWMHMHVTRMTVFVSCSMSSMRWKALCYFKGSSESVLEWNVMEGVWRMGCGTLCSPWRKKNNHSSVLTNQWTLRFQVQNLRTAGGMDLVQHNNTVHTILC